jgi:hypothetical protein
MVLELSMLWFGRKNKEIVAFAKSLADEFFENVPPALIEKQYDKKDQKGAKKAKRRYLASLDDTIEAIVRFKQQNKLKVYGKAKLYLEFTNRLKSLGYEQHLADKVQETIVLRVA